MSGYVCIIMYYIRVHYYDVIILNTHNVAHVIILPHKIIIIYTTLLALHITHSTTTYYARVIGTFKVLFICQVFYWSWNCRGPS